MSTISGSPSGSSAGVRGTWLLLAAAALLAGLLLIILGDTAGGPISADTVIAPAQSTWSAELSPVDIR